MILDELTEIRITATGETKPRVDSGIEILLVQNGIVSVGRLNYDPNEFFSTEIEHPANQKDLDSLATEIVKSRRSELLTSGISYVLTSPINSNERMIWENGK